MTQKTQPDAGFKTENRDGEDVLVKRLAFGGEVQKDGEAYCAFDKNGNLLGTLIPDLETAECMATGGFIGIPSLEEASVLSLWQLWEDARASGTRVMLAEDGTQIMCIGDATYMTVRDLRDEEGDWDIHLITDKDLYDAYYDEERGFFNLKICCTQNVFEVA